MMTILLGCFAAIAVLPALAVIYGVLVADGRIVTLAGVAALQVGRARLLVIRRIGGLSRL